MGRQKCSRMRRWLAQPGGHSRTAHMCVTSIKTTEQLSKHFRPLRPQSTHWRTTRFPCGCCSIHKMPVVQANATGWEAGTQPPERKPGNPNTWFPQTQWVPLSVFFPRPGGTNKSPERRSRDLYLQLLLGGPQVTKLGRRRGCHLKAHARLRGCFGETTVKVRDSPDSCACCQVPQPLSFQVCGARTWDTQLITNC